MAERRHRPRRYGDATLEARVWQLEEEFGDFCEDWEQLVTAEELRAMLKDYITRKERRAGLAEGRDWTALSLQLAMWLTTVLALVLTRH